MSLNMNGIRSLIDATKEIRFTTNSHVIDIQVVKYGDDGTVKKLLGVSLGQSQLRQLISHLQMCVKDEQLPEKITMTDAQILEKVRKRLTL